MILPPASRLVPLALVLAVAAFNLLCMPGQFLPGDPNAWRREAQSILVSGELRVPDNRVFGEHGQYFAQNERTGERYSKYGVMNAVMSLPPMLLQQLAGGVDWALGARPWLLVYNVWNVVLSAALAALLYAAAAPYTPRLGLRVLFVIGAMYCSFLWFYQRAQSSELYLVVFFTALFLCLRAFLRRHTWGWLWAAWAFVLALVLTRVVYGLLLPVVALFVLYALRQDMRRLMPQLALHVALPPVLIVALLGWINDVKFGAPWLTGYHQWGHASHWPTGRWSEGLYGYFVSARFSIFLHFPLLIFALFGLRRFMRLHRLDGIFIFGTLAVFAVFLARLPSWAGEWTYGPRYLLFVAPLASLPALALAETLLEKPRAWPAAAAGAVALAVLGAAAYLQVQVNRLPFFIYYHARAAEEVSPVAARYFRGHHVGIISIDLLRHRQNNFEGMPYFEDLKRRSDAAVLAEYQKVLAAMVDGGNWFWGVPPGERIWR